jgi:hypothetical protein
VSAYVIPVADLDPLREDLLDLVGAAYWHSTEAHMTADGQAKLLELAEYVGAGDEPVIVAARQPIDSDDVNGERARAECLTALLGALASGEFCEPTSLVVFEERKFASQRNADERTIKAARAANLIPRNMQVLPSSPTYEKLLWLPDIVCFALYQSMSRKGRAYVSPFEKRIQIIMVESQS